MPVPTYLCLRASAKVSVQPCVCAFLLVDISVRHVHNVSVLTYVSVHTCVCLRKCVRVRVTACALLTLTFT